MIPASRANVTPMLEAGIVTTVGMSVAPPQVTKSSGNVSGKQSPESTIYLYFLLVPIP
jgi:hypothetical protein